jgi:catechol-2,3-dioxygenase
MATIGMKHAVLWVTDPEASAAFYREALGLEVKAEAGDAIFMTSPASATDHDLGLFPADERVGGRRNAGLYHIAWEVTTLGELAETRERLQRMDALIGESSHVVSRSLYARDPDGIEFEVMWEVPLDLVDDDSPTTLPLDLEADITRFGADRPGRGAT